MLLLPRLWKSLDEVPGWATDRREWRHRLGDELGAAQRFLKPTGQIARRLACPHPSGDDCPRRVVKLPSGSFQATCGNNPAVCDEIAIAHDDLIIDAVDCRRLGKALADALGAKPDFHDNGSYVELGALRVGRTRGMPIVLLAPDPSARTSFESASFNVGQPTLMLLPTADLIPRPQREALRERGHEFIYLAGMIGLSDAGSLALMPAAEELLHSLRDNERAATDKGGPAWSLPADARWEELLLELTAPEAIIARFRGTSRNFDPREFGMRDRRNGSTTVAWELLQRIVVNSGRMEWRRDAHDSKRQKQKQTLSRLLKGAFGLGDEPIIWDHREHDYVARFQVLNHLPKALRDEISSRR